MSYFYFIKITGFLSTLSLRRATVRPTGRPAYHTGFLSTLSLRRATCFSVPYRLKVAISIHALLAESDAERVLEECCEFAISIHALLAESDGIFRVLEQGHRGFLSTLSLRRATSTPRFTPAPSRNFYPRSPCGERQETQTFEVTALCISIHALLAESDVLQS